MVVSSTIAVDGKGGRDSVQVTGLSIGQSAVHARSAYRAFGFVNGVSEKGHNQGSKKAVLT